MRKKSVKITDRKGNSFTISIGTEDLGTQIKNSIFDDNTTIKNLGHWKTIEKSFIRPNDGHLFCVKSKKTDDLTTKDLHFYSKEMQKTLKQRPNVIDDFCGMKLFKYEDWLGVNKQGEGVIDHPWTLSLLPGEIKWEVI